MDPTALRYHARYLMTISICLSGSDVGPVKCLSNKLLQTNIIYPVRARANLLGANTECKYRLRAVMHVPQAKTYTSPEGGDAERCAPPCLTPSAHHVLMSSGAESVGTEPSSSRRGGGGFIAAPESGKCSLIIYISGISFIFSANA